MLNGLVTIRVVDPKSTKFRIWDAVIWNTAGDDATSVAAGYFEVKEYFLPVCCDFKGGPQIRVSVPEIFPIVFASAVNPNVLPFYRIQ